MDAEALADADVVINAGPTTAEADYIRGTSLAHRRRYGQFFTPVAVAAYMAKWVCAARPSAVLDPAFGLGVFHRQVMQARAGRTIRYVAFEKDPAIIQRLPRPAPGADLQVIQGDYLDADYRSFDGIICNPPYLQFQKFEGRHRVLKELEEATGERLGGCSNMAAAFLLKALHQLAPGGHLAFLSPMEFFDTRYGAGLRRRLLRDGLLKHVVVIPDAPDVFPEAVTSVAVILCRRDGVCADVTCRQVASLRELQDPANESLAATHRFPTALMARAGKWRALFDGGAAGAGEPPGYVSLRRYGRFLRGIATGANGFFVGSRQKFAELEIPLAQRVPCITRSAQVDRAVFTDSDHARLDQAHKPVWCLDVREPVPPSVESYLEEGERAGYSRRYLTRKRTPWYRMEQRAPAPLWIGTFYRDRLKVVRNLSAVRTLTCFHSFYPEPDCAGLVDALFVYLLSAPGEAQVRLQRSVYAAGLEKVEPGDMNRVCCPPPAVLNSLPGERIREVIDAACHDVAGARALASVLFSTGPGGTLPGTGEAGHG